MLTSYHLLALLQREVYRHMSPTQVQREVYRMTSLISSHSMCVVDLLIVNATSIASHAIVC